jgi:enoyl-[acyl-carrier protein] reductase I
MGILDGKRIHVTGVLTDASLAFGVAELAQREGAEIALTGAGRGLSLTQRTARKLPQPCEVLELDVTSADQAAAVREALGSKWGRVDGALHAIGFAPPSCLGEGAFLAAPWPDVATTVQVSAYSFKSLATATLPLLGAGASIVGMDFDNRQAWPAYDWMGVAKSTLESVTRYLARDLGPQGIRVNLVAAGPVRTMAAKSIPGFSAFEDAWDGRAPLGWNVDDPVPVAKTVCALLSDWLPVTTGSMVWADGGFHAIGV